MAQSVVTDNIEKTQTTSYYGYDAFGRRTLVQDSGDSLMRTLYDGQSFDILRESAVYTGSNLATTFTANQNTDAFNTNEPTGERYRFISDQTAESYDNDPERFTGMRMPLYAKGQAVGISVYEDAISSQERAYFGTDILGSVRSTTDEYATIEERYEYDAFGTPYDGDFDDGMDFGYTGKPYDETTNLYNYGYRDYSPQTARFTTVDPIRDGNNWFSYVVNDPVNYVDLWGLSPSDATASEVASAAMSAAEKIAFLAGITLKTNKDNKKEIGGWFTAGMHYVFRDGDIIREASDVWIKDSMFKKVTDVLPEIILDIVSDKPNATLDSLKSKPEYKLIKPGYHFGHTPVEILDIYVGNDVVLLHVELFKGDGLWDVTHPNTGPVGDTYDDGWEFLGKPYGYEERDAIISIPRADWDASGAPVQ